MAASNEGIPIRVVDPDSPGDLRREFDATYARVAAIRARRLELDAEERALCGTLMALSGRLARANKGVALDPCA